MSLASDLIGKTQIATYARDGAVHIPGLFAEWVDVIKAAIAENMAAPGPYAAENVTDGESGSFFDDYCNWERIPALRDIVENSPCAEAAALIMRSNRAQFFHDHILVKEPGTSKPTPWHQDAPYYFVDGRQNVSFWIPVDPVDEASLRLIKGSHLWDKMVLPVRWLNNGDFYPESSDYLPVPDPDQDPDRYETLEWSMVPGDAVLFDFRAVHGARANMTSRRRRALSLRWVGDDARYVERPGRTSPPFPGHDMSPGQRLREDWFPVVWK
ncbi:phytanoyl-CoA dioxygenase family protein [Denitrobaculum tricleocarpae]|uniref:Phytanoyl-CoA dioxygenase n=1 Tax=Denitrobaculum tricleocarpae TaxID=2591009 RepID=A0A545TTS6_9PROT|nr:phytanoyl-CoA dioxygenase family protein [Denitrobaculum tricleocarpae]TQV80617.1 phytanoyl-CoA dioxygenase [Denitrobaculum tricleocarpae]